MTKESTLKVICILTMVFGALITLAGDSRALHFKFIGNMAFRFSDGSVVVFTDFPYTSGYSGYMRYNPEEVVSLPEALCLITHGHADHWNADLFAKMGSTIIAPAEVLNSIKAGTKIPIVDRAQYRNVVIHAFRTPHRGEHFSYLVEWNGFRLFFTGDTEETTQLLSAKKLDIAFVSPWLLASVKSENKKIDAKKIIIYHHTPGEEVVQHQDRLLPKQNETFVLSDHN